MRRLRIRWPLAALLIVIFGVATGFGAVRTNALGTGDRFDRLMAKVGAILHPAPHRDTLPTIVVTPYPSASDKPVLVAGPGTDGPARGADPTARPTPRPTREPVDVNLVKDADKVFASELTDKMCAVAGTQMVLAILGKGNTSDAFQWELAGRIGEWESWDDSHNGGWGPAAIAQALAAYGVKGYEVRAYEARGDALRDSAIALLETGKPVVLLPWWGAHTWVMTGYRADADPTVFHNSRITGTYILDPWYPRISSIWGPSDPPGNFEDLDEMKRNFIGWSRPEGAYPDRDGKFLVVIPTR
jgi:hypothetical protein